MNAERVVIHYHRPPDRTERFEQIVLERTPRCVVTLLQSAALRRPMVIGGTIALEPAAAVVWFTFPGEWHDIGRFHTRADEFTGLYANVLTPVQGVDGNVWRTTDLFLDVWQDPGGRTRVLDADELAEAHRRGALDTATARRARQEAARLIRASRSGLWPPAIVAAWTLERARRHVHG